MHPLGLLAELVGSFRCSPWRDEAGPSGSDIHARILATPNEHKTAPSQKPRQNERMAHLTTRRSTGGQGPYQSARPENCPQPASATTSPSSGLVPHERRETRKNPFENLNDRTGLGVDVGADNARLGFVEVVLRKLGKGSRAVAGRLVRAPRKGSVVVIEFPDGMHEYVTTPVKRVLRLAGREVFYIETINSRYRLEVRGREDAVAENAG